MHVNRLLAIVLQFTINKRIGFVFVFVPAIYVIFINNQHYQRPMQTVNGCRIKTELKKTFFDNDPLVVARKKSTTHQWNTLKMWNEREKKANSNWQQRTLFLWLIARSKVFRVMSVAFQSNSMHWRQHLTHDNLRIELCIDSEIQFPIQ